MRRKLMMLSGIGLGAGVLLSQTAGIRPRPTAGEYPVQEQVAGATVAAAALSKEQVRNTFATNLADGYIVLEIAVYPSSVEKSEAQKVSVSPDDFMLKIGGSTDLVRPASPDTVASVLQRKNAPRSTSASDVTVYPTANIGYGRGTTPDGRRVGGWDTGVGVGVGVGGANDPRYPTPASTDRDRGVMRAELSDKALPDGPVVKPVAGYLYFPAPSKKKDSGVFELNYYGSSGKAHLFLPLPQK